MLIASTRTSELTLLSTVRLPLLDGVLSTNRGSIAIFTCVEINA